MRHVRLLLLLGCIAALGSARDAAADRASEAEVRRAVVFNLLQFVEWPDGRQPPNGEFRLCVVDDAGRDDVLAALHGRRLRERRIAVLRIGRDLGDLSRCETLFIGAGNPRLVAATAASDRRAPLLVIAEGDEALQHGATIGLSTSSGRMVFDVNLAAARSAGLVVSSKLLRLARRVIE